MDKTFVIAPASSSASTAIIGIIILVAVILIAIVGMLLFSAYSMKNVKFEVNDSGLKIGPAIYGRTIPKEQIIMDKIQVVNLKMDPPYTPTLKTNGVGLPGYSEGWFKLKNGEKALLFVTDNSNVVYIPTSQGYSVLLSPKDAEGFYQSLRQWK